MEGIQQKKCRENSIMQPRVILMYLSFKFNSYHLVDILFSSIYSSPVGFEAGGWVLTCQKRSDEG